MTDVLGYAIVGENGLPKRFHIVRGGIENNEFIEYSRRGGILCVTPNHGLYLFGFDEKGKHESDIAIDPFDIESIVLNDDDEIVIKSRDDFGYKISNGGDYACVRALCHLLMNKHNKKDYMHKSFESEAFDGAYT